MSDTILTPDQVQMHKMNQQKYLLHTQRIVDREKLMMGYRNHAKKGRVGDGKRKITKLERNEMRMNF